VLLIDRLCTGEYFDTRGVITFETLEELGIILGRLDTPEKREADYASRKDAIQRNYDIAMAEYSELNGVFGRLRRMFVGPSGEMSTLLIVQSMNSLSLQSINSLSL
jgi:hypothetical protein